MSRSRCPVCLLVCLWLPGCDRDGAAPPVTTTAPATQPATTAPSAWRQATQAVRSAGSRLSAEYEESQVLSHAQRFLRAVDGRDLESLRRLCSVGEEAAGDYGAILGDYYHAFAIENADGPAAARARLASDLASPGISPARARALRGLDACLEAKGSLRTREAAGLVLIIALECQYPHQGGRAGAIIADQLGLIDFGKTTAGPSTAPAAPASRPAPAGTEPASAPRVGDR